MDLNPNVLISQILAYSSTWKGRNSQGLVVVGTIRCKRYLPLPLPPSSISVPPHSLLHSPLTPLLVQAPQPIILRFVASGRVAGRGVTSRGVEEPLLMLLAPLLQVAGLLLLPLLKVPHILHRWPLPCCCTCVMIHVVDTATVVKATLPAVVEVDKWGNNLKKPQNMGHYTLRHASHLYAHTRTLTPTHPQKRTHTHTRRYTHTCTHHTCIHT